MCDKTTGWMDIEDGYPTVIEVAKKILDSQANKSRGIQRITFIKKQKVVYSHHIAEGEKSLELNTKEPDFVILLLNATNLAV